MSDRFLGAGISASRQRRAAGKAAPGSSGRGLSDTTFKNDVKFWLYVELFVVGSGSPGRPLVLTENRSFLRHLPTEISLKENFQNGGPAVKLNV